MSKINRFKRGSKVLFLPKETLMDSYQVNEVGTFKQTIVVNDLELDLSWVNEEVQVVSDSQMNPKHKAICKINGYWFSEDVLLAPPTGDFEYPSRLLKFIRS